MAYNPTVARYLAGGFASILILVAIVFGLIRFDFISSPFKTATPTDSTGTTSVDVFMAQMENREAWYDHRAIATWVASCLGVHSPENLPESLRWSLEPPGRFFSVWKEEKPTGELTGQQRSVINLSNALFMERTDSFEKAGDVFKSLEKFQVSAIIVGLLTTVFISLSSTDIIKDNNLTLGTIKIAVKIFAIVLPAVGTALAAMNAFYDPKSDLIKYSRISDSAASLQRQIASGIAGMPCVAIDAKNDTTNPEWQRNDTQIREWLNAHKALSTSGQKTENTAGSDSSANRGWTGGTSPTDTPKPTQ